MLRIFKILLYISILVYCISICITIKNTNYTWTELDINKNSFLSLKELYYLFDTKKQLICITYTKEILIIKFPINKALYKKCKKISYEYYFLKDGIPFKEEVLFE